MSDDALPEADRLDGAPHPRETVRLFGQDVAEAAFLGALNAGRLPHAWLLTGPRGVGKASFAWRAARYLIATAPRPATRSSRRRPPKRSTSIPNTPSPAASAPCRSPTSCCCGAPGTTDRKRLKAQLTVDEVRGLKGFFAWPGGARRVVIVDCADEMNPSAANALLKELEEPPKNTVMFLISHQPSGLLPTIRSRCRTLRFDPLSPPIVAAALDQAGLTLPGDASAEAIAPSPKDPSARPCNWWSRTAWRFTATSCS
jgi:DNA polymerase-3 subunit delta'